MVSFILTLDQVSNIGGEMYSIKEISNLINGTIIGDDNLEFSKLSPFFEAAEEDITFAADESMTKNILGTKAKVVIVPKMDKLPKEKTYIVLEQNPRNVLPLLLNHFKVKTKKIEKQIEDSAQISENVTIDLNSYIGHDVKIGENSVIYPNVTILEGTEIGKNCIIYPNAVVREFCILGDNVILQPGSVIGADGFGFIKDKNGNNMKIEQIGNVIIEDNVEIGANSCVDRGAIGSTRVKKGTKIDNLVHIAHNDIIGENCFIIALTGISGSVEVGDNTVLAGQVGVAGHLKIGSNVVVAAKSGITNDIPDNSKMSGYPLRPHMEDLRIKMSLGKVPELIKKVRELEKLVKKDAEK